MSKRQMLDEEKFRSLCKDCFASKVFLSFSFDKLFSQSLFPFFSAKFHPVMEMMDW